MIIEISADTVVWFIAVMLVVLCALLFFILMAIRILAMVIQENVAKISKKIPNLGGGGNGGGGGPMDMLGGLFGMLGGGK